MASNINRVVLTGNLTKDPEKKGNGPCRLRLAVNEREKQGEEWGERANFFDVIVWGNQGDNCLQYLSKGRPIAVEGRLRWHEWEAQDGGKRQQVEVVAHTVQFLGGGKDGGGSSGGGGGFQPSSDVPADTSDLDVDVPSGGSDDDIPF
jgi:single-strand DNA-binding protein